MTNRPHFTHIHPPPPGIFNKKPIPPPPTPGASDCPFPLPEQKKKTNPKRPPSIQPQTPQPLHLNPAFTSSTATISAAYHPHTPQPPLPPLPQPTIILRVPKPGRFKPGCLQFLRSFALFCRLAFALFCAVLCIFACFCVRPCLEQLRLGTADSKKGSTSTPFLVVFVRFRSFSAQDFSQFQSVLVNLVSFSLFQLF